MEFCAMHIRMVHFCVYIVVYVCGGRVVHMNQGCTSFFYGVSETEHIKQEVYFPEILTQH